MSWVSNILVSVSREDRPTVELLNAWLRTEAPRRESVPGLGVGFLNDLTSDPDNAWGGPKQPECDVWGGALNHADLDAVVAKFAVLPWRIPAAAQLLVMDQEQSYFRLWMLRDGAPQQYAPERPADDSAW